MVISDLSKHISHIALFPLTRIHPANLIAIILFSSVLVKPQKLDQTIYIPVQQPLQIFVPTGSPGYAAFQDLELSEGPKSGAVEVAHFFPVQLRAKDVRLTLPSELRLEKAIVPQIQLKPFVVSQPNIKVPEKIEAKIVTNVNLKPLALGLVTQAPGVKIAKASPQLIRGKVELTEGLAYMGSESMVRIYHKDPASGEESEVTAVWPQKGQYEILAPENKGYLVAELRNINGNVIGKDEIDLSESKDKKPVNFKIKPRSDLLEVEVTEGHNYLGSPNPVKMARVLNPALGIEFERDQTLNRFSEAQYTKSSNLLVGAYADGFIPSIALGGIGQVLELNLYSKPMLDGLRQILRPGPTSTGDSIIWGRVMSEGKPVVGAKVYLITAKEAQATYFSSYLPDQSLGATGVEGDFVISNVKPGLHMLAVYHPKQKFPLEYVPVEDGMASPILVERSTLKRAVARTYSPFPSASPTLFESGTIRVNDSKKPIQLNSNSWKPLKIYRGNGLMEINTEPTEDLAAAHFFWSRDKEQLNVPLISLDWLSQLSQSAGLTAKTNQGLVVGFGFRGAFEVYITAENAHILYLDRAGKLVPADADPKIRNGFVIVGAGTDYHQVSVIQQSTGKISSRIVQPKTDSVALVF